MKKIRCSFYFPLAASVFILASCASSKIDMQKFDDRLQDGNYSECASMLEVTKKAANIDTAIDISLLKNYGGDYEGSSEFFNATNRAIDEAFTKSIMKGVAAAAVNENATDYSGNVYEYLLVNAFNSLNYYNQGNLEEALVEIRMIENKQKEYVNKYGALVLTDADDTGSAARSAAQLGIDLSQHEDSIPRKATEKDIYKDSPFAHYLASLMYLAHGSGDALLHEKEYRALNPNGAGLKEDFSVPRGKGRLDVVAFAGKIKHRVEGSVVVPFYISDIPMLNPHLKYVFPSVAGIPKNTYAVKVSLSNGENTELALVENFDEAVDRDVASKARKAFVRSFIRSTVKEASVVASAIFAYNNCTSDLLRELCLISIGPAINAVNLTETADVRQATCFPGQALGGGFTLDPGFYSLKVEYFKNGQPLGTEEIQKIEVRADSITIVESVMVK